MGNALTPNCVMLLLILLTYSTPVHAGPSSDQPKALLDPIGIVPQSKSLSQTASQLTLECEAEITSLKASAKLPAPQILVTLRDRLDTASRAAEFLRYMNEPVGFELQALIGQLIGECEKIGRAIASAPNGVQAVGRYYKIIEKGTEKRSKLTAKIRETFDAGKTTEAYELIVPEFKLIISHGVFFTSSQIRPFVEPFMNAIPPIATANGELLTQQANDAYRSRLETNIERLIAFDGQLEQVSQKILQPTDGASLELKRVQLGIESIEKAWRSMIAMLAQSTSIIELLQQNQVSELPNLPYSGNELAQRVARSLATVTQQAASQLPDDQRHQLFAFTTDQIGRFRQGLSHHSRQNQANSPLQIYQGAIATLVQGNLEFAHAGAAYSRATDQYLDWRQRYTRKWCSVQQSDGENLRTAFASARPPKSTLRPTWLPTPRIPQQVNQLADLSQPSHWELSEVASNLVGQDISLNQLQPVSNNGGRVTAVSWLQPNGLSSSEVNDASGSLLTYGKAVVPNWPADQVEALRRDLLAADGAAPLSPTASAAISQLNDGYRLAIGGEVTSIAIEPAISRLANLASTASVILPSDAPDRAATNILSQGTQAISGRILWRLTIKPTWMATEFSHYSP